MMGNLRFQSRKALVDFVSKRVPIETCHTRKGTSQTHIVQFGSRPFAVGGQGVAKGRQADRRRAKRPGVQQQTALSRTGGHKHHPIAPAEWTSEATNTSSMAPSRLYILDTIRPGKLPGKRAATHRRGDQIRGAYLKMRRRERQVPFIDTGLPKYMDDQAGHVLSAALANRTGKSPVEERCIKV